jgi:hypothetical protein
VPAAGRGSTKVVPVFTFVCVDIEVPIRNASLEVIHSDYHDNHLHFMKAADVGCAAP